MSLVILEAANLTQIEVLKYLDPECHRMFYESGSFLSFFFFFGKNLQFMSLNNLPGMRLWKPPLSVCMKGYRT